MIKEIIVYKIQEGKESEFLSIKEQMIKESCDLKGLHSSTTSKSLDQKYVYIDTMIWDSKDRAKEAFPEFEKLPTTPIFFGASSNRVGRSYRATPSG